MDPIIVHPGFLAAYPPAPPINYEAAMWAMVFPLAMYTASTWQLAIALDLPFLKAIPQVMFYVALLAWALVFLVSSIICISGLLFITEQRGCRKELRTKALPLWMERFCSLKDPLAFCRVPKMPMGILCPIFKI